MIPLIKHKEQLPLFVNVAKNVPFKGHRLSWVDHARGIAIIFVVYRHVVDGLKQSNFPVTNFMFNSQEIIYNFRMAMFFVLSGIFIANSLKKRSRATILKDRASTILYPYLLWGAILISLQVLFVHVDYIRYTNSNHGWFSLTNLLLNPRAAAQLWYLLALFNTTCIYLVTSKFIKNDYIQIGIAIVLHVLSFAPILHDVNFFSDAFYFYPYFIVGTFLSRVFLFKEKTDSILNIRHLLWLTPLFVAGQWFWFTHRDDDLKYMALFFAINIVACYFIYILCYKLSQTRLRDSFAYLGKYSLYIYILHVPVSAVIRNIFLHANASINIWIIVTVCCLCGLIVPILLYNSLNKFGFGFLFSLKRKKINERV